MRRGVSHRPCVTALPAIRQRSSLHRRIGGRWRAIAPVAMLQITGWRVMNRVMKRSVKSRRSSDASVSQISWMTFRVRRWKQKTPLAILTATAAAA